MSGWLWLVLLLVVAALDDWQRRKLRRKYETALEREHRMRLVAEAAIEAMAEAWAEQFAINRYRVSEANRAILKTPVGGQSN